MESKIKEYLSYCPDTGEIRWIKDLGCKIKAGRLAGCGGTEKSPYRFVRIFGKKYKAHRLAWFLFHGKHPDGHIDHKNGNQSDNRINNLRVVTQVENQQNRKKKTKNGEYCCGVTSRNGKWYAHITVKGETINLGRFIEKNDAQIAYLKAKKEHHQAYTSGVGESCQNEINRLKAEYVSKNPNATVEEYVREMRALSIKHGIYWASNGGAKINGAR